MIDVPRGLSRPVRIAGLFAMLIVLTAGRPILQGARQILIPMETNPPVGVEFKVKVGDTIVASRFMDWNLARLDVSTPVAVDRFSQVIGPEADLEGFGATQASREHLPTSGEDFSWLLPATGRTPLTP